MSKFLAISRITLTNFRNYSQFRFETNAPMVVLHGPNGAGKTNLLEAISLLIPGRGLRRAQFSELAHSKRGQNWAVATQCETMLGYNSIGTAWKQGDNFNSTNKVPRLIQIDGKPQKSSNSLLAYLTILWLTPAMDGLFNGPPSGRRRFLDRLVMAFDAEHGTRTNSFERTMRQRNHSLQHTPHNTSLLDALERQLSEYGVAVAAGRLHALEALNALILRQKQQTRQSTFPYAELSISGELEQALASNSALKCEDDYFKTLNLSRRQDMAAGRTLIGPHRSDFLVRHGPKDQAAELCSTGEQKALLIGLILAHARAVKEKMNGSAPILLFDEISAHLDASRRAGLFDELKELGSQTWLTGTETHLFTGLEDYAEFLSLSDGKTIPSS